MHKSSFVRQRYNSFQGFEGAPPGPLPLQSWTPFSRLFPGSVSSVADADPLTRMWNLLWLFGALLSLHMPARVTPVPVLAPDSAPGSPAFPLIDPSLPARSLSGDSWWFLVDRDGWPVWDTDRDDRPTGLKWESRGVPTPDFLQEHGVAPGTPLVVARILEPWRMVSSLERLAGDGYLLKDHPQLGETTTRTLSFLQRDPSDQELFAALNDVAENAMGMDARMRGWEEEAARTASSDFERTQISRQDADAILDLVNVNTGQVTSDHRQSRA